MSMVLILGILYVLGMESQPPDQVEAATPSRDDAIRVPGGNIVLIVAYTLRADHLGSHGYQRPTSPNLDSLARESVLFQRSYSHAPWTHPSISSLMTGLHPRYHGVHQWNHQLRDKLLTLSEALKAGGYNTAAIMSHSLFDPRHGHKQGYDIYDLSALGDQDPNKAITSKKVTDRAVLALEMLKEPFFLFVHYFDPHSDYIHHHKQFPWAGDDDMSRYDSEIAFTDFHIGRLLQELQDRGIKDRTVVAFTADHGEEFREHGGDEHGVTLYEELIRVPLMLRIPGVKPAKVNKMVTQTHVAPTLLDLVGQPVPAQHAKRPIRFMPDGIKIKQGALISETRLGVYMRAISKGDYKLIHAVEGDKQATVELYNLRTDRGERHNLAQKEKGRAEALLQELERFYQPAEAVVKQFKLDDPTTAKLKSLGYLNGP